VDWGSSTRGLSQILTTGQTMEKNKDFFYIKKTLNRYWQHSKTYVLNTMIKTLFFSSKYAEFEGFLSKEPLCSSHSTPLVLGCQVMKFCHKKNPFILYMSCHIYNIVSRTIAGW
jgi:hypothetical protein